MSHFDEILRQGESLINHNFHENEELYDKSTNQSNQLTAGNEHINSPFDSSPKASMSFFSLNSPRQNGDNFQFNHQISQHRNISKEHFQPISRRLQFQEDASLFCEEEIQEIQEEQLSMKEEEQWNFESSRSIPKGKKIKKQKNSKGLKNLSNGVYDIVAEKAQTTYKEVAQVLTERLSKEVKESMKSNAGFEAYKNLQKDQHNIKRRVYDALNVLISADLLRKDGKKVICNYKLNKALASKQQLEQEKARLASQYSLRYAILQQKKAQLEVICQRKQKLRSTFEKNKQMDQKPHESIRLPFIAVKTCSNDIKNIDFQQEGVIIDFKSSIQIMGDIDMIEQLQQ